MGSPGLRSDDMKRRSYWLASWPCCTLCLLKLCIHVALISACHRGYHASRLDWPRDRIDLFAANSNWVSVLTCLCPTSPWKLMQLWQIYGEVAEGNINPRKTCGSFFMTSARVELAIFGTDTRCTTNCARIPSGQHLGVSVIYIVKRTTLIQSEGTCIFLNSVCHSWA
jgi:hypothetical protein